MDLLYDASLAIGSLELVPYLSASRVQLRWAPVYAVVFHVVCTDITYPESLFVRLELLWDSVFVEL